MKPSQEVMKYLKHRNGSGPKWCPEWSARFGVLKELDDLCRAQPKERIYSNAYSELLTELRASAKTAAELQDLDEMTKKLLRGGSMQPAS